MESSLVDTLWIVICAVLVFAMQAGFLCLETGLTRSKNNINVALKNVSDFGISVLLFWAIGCGLMFGLTQQGWIGTSGFFADFTEVDFRVSAFILFQIMFCSTAVTIVSGAVAERMKFAGYLFLTVVIALLVYPIFGHWVWNGTYATFFESANLIDNAARLQRGGWLEQRGFIDFAGGSVVHSVGGWAALAAILHIGPRAGRFPPGEPPQQISGSNIPLATLGALILCVGWFGFNGGSVLAFNQLVVLVIMNTIIAGVAGMVTAMFISRYIVGHIEVSACINGLLAGLVAITAGCNLFTTPDALFIGSVGGALMSLTHWLLERWRIDDAISVIPVHLAAGIWGTLAVGIFGDLELIGAGISRSEQIWVQLFGILVCALWSFGIVYIALQAIRKVTTLRASGQDEYIGLNISEHGASTELNDFFRVLDEQSQTADVSKRVPVEPFTEVGQIATRYNAVMDRLERALFHSQTIVKQSTDSIITFSVETYQILQANPATATIFGAKEEGMIGRLITDFIGPIDRLLLPEKFNGAQYKRRVQIEGTHIDGSAIPLEITLSKGKIEGKEILIGTFSDISERNAAIESEKRAEVAEAANAAKSDFLASMSHELRTPMNAVIGMSQLLLDMKMPTQQRGFLETIYSSGNALMTIINEILDLSKIEAGKLELAPHTFELFECIEDCLIIFSTRCAKKGIELGYWIDPDVPTQVVGDMGRLRQIIINLVGNAVKFTEQGEIIIRIGFYDPTDEDEHEIPINIPHLPSQMALKFSVTDTGIGIKPEKLTQLFTPFTQADSTTTRKYGGTGLGLTISKRLAELMGGTVWATSELGNGSEFHFVIQVGKSLDEEVRHRQIEHLQGKSVLIVDDNQTNRQILFMQTERWGMNPVVAESAEEALAICNRATTFDLAIVDLFMPEMDGLDLTASIRSNQSIAALPVVVLTSAAESNYVERAKKLGVHAYLAKPVRKNHLYETLVSVLDPTADLSGLERNLSSFGNTPALPDNIKILLVEDNIVNQKVALQILKRVGYDADSAISGVEALEQIRSQRYDIVLMDIQMPEMDGLEATRRIRDEFAQSEQPWIIALTANALLEDRNACIDAGMNGYVSKPIEIEKLVEALRQGCQVPAL